MLRWFIKHPLAANLMIILMIALGFMYIPKLQRTSFPEIPDTRVLMSVYWQGASNKDLNEAICQPAEDLVADVDNILSYSCRGRSETVILTAEMEWGEDYDEFYSDFKDALDRLKLPEGADDARFEKASSRIESAVASIALTSDMPLMELLNYAKQVEDDLKRFPAIGDVDISGVEEQKLYIYVSEEKLQSFNITMEDLSLAINSYSLDATMGSFSAKDKYIKLTLNELLDNRAKFEDFIIKRANDGGYIYLKDLAKVDYNILEKRPLRIFNNQPAIIISVERGNNADLLEAANNVLNYVDMQNKRADSEIKFNIYSNFADVTQSRLDMVVSNAISGIILAFLALWLFFNFKFSFWILAGIVFSFVGGCVLMLFFGQTINLMTLVGLLITIGILMDDAIVVAENIHKQYQLGNTKEEAAYLGVKKVVPGVISSFLTTAAMAYVMTNLQGGFGAIITAVPFVMLLVLVVSLFEAFFILPHHLAHALRDREKEQTKFRAKFYQGFLYVQDNIICKVIEFALKVPLIFTVGFILFFASSVFLLKSSIVKQADFPTLEGDSIDARILYQNGLKREKTQEGIDILLAALTETLTQYQNDFQDETNIIETVTIEYNRNRDTTVSGENQATVSIDLLPSDSRKVTALEFASMWRTNTGNIADVEAINFTQAAVGPSSSNIRIRLFSEDIEKLAAASEYLISLIALEDVFISTINDMRKGDPIWQLELLPSAYDAGLSSLDINRQLSRKMIGYDIDEIFYNGEMTDINLRLGEVKNIDINWFNDINIKDKLGNFIPLTSLVSVKNSNDQGAINRRNGQQMNIITTNVDEGMISPLEGENLITNKILPEFRKSYPDINVRFGGNADSRSQFMSSLLKSALLGLISIFCILALQFKNLIAPILVIIIIPLAFAGSVWGHFIFGMPISNPSKLGIALLAGIAVNDSILLVLALQDNLKQKMQIDEAALEAARSRFRAIVLTSLTTIAGMVPLLLERDIQAQIVRPLVVSIVFGIFTTTMMVLFMIPIAYSLLYKLHIIAPVGQKNIFFKKLFMLAFGDYRKV